MRIIAGLAKGRRLATPGARGGVIIRPTADRAREALFSILGWEVIREANVLDLFAGTGAMGLEALSRGAKEAVFVDNNQLAIELIQCNAAACGFSTKVQVIRHNLLKSLSFWRRVSIEGPTAPAFDLIFLDPPYRQGHCRQLLVGLLNGGLVRADATVVFEDASSEQLPTTVETLTCYDQRAYGDTGFWLYENRPAVSGQHSTTDSNP